MLRIWFVAAVVASLPFTLHAQPVPDSVRLREIVVTGSRVTVPARIRAIAADRIDRDELARRQVTRLADALRLLPGAALVSTGALGGTTSTFFRGVNSNQTLILIDGIRVNDANALPGALLGGFELSPLDRLEIARGPQSTSFGGAAIGGVISIGGAVDQGSRAGITVDGGSFATYRARAFGSTRRGRLAIAGAATIVDAANERPDNDYAQRTQQVRIEFAATPVVTIGGTLRGLQQSFSSPGDIRDANTTPVGTSVFDQTIGTVFLEARPTSHWSTRFTAGGQDYFLQGRSRYNGGSEYVSLLGVTREVIDWQHRVSIGSSVTAVAGINAEWSRVRDNDGPKEERLAAGYAELLAMPTRDLAISAGIRRDDYTTFTARTTGRVSAAYFVPGLGAKVRGTFGTGFMPPSLASRYGSAFQKANPGLRPERSRGGDIGIDKFFARGRAVVSATAFHNRLTDLIGYESATYPDLGRSINIDRATTKGIELAGRGEVGSVDGRIAYTYLATDNPAGTPGDGRRLLRRPKHTAGADMSWQGRRLTLGGGFTAVLDRVDADFNSYPSRLVDPGNYLDARLLASWRVGSGLQIRARADNLFGTRYEEAYGYPALGRRVQVGLSFDPTR